MQTRPEPQLFDDLSISAQTNFAELVEQAQARMLDRSILDLPGSFNKKEIKGVEYWYWQFRDLEGKTRQSYLGPDDERLRELIRQRTAGKKGHGHDGLARLAQACTALGCMNITPQHFKVINRLAEHGFFNAGGVLIGTHAFIAMANMLGVRWSGGWSTNDIDFAHAGKNVSLALPANTDANVHDAITSLEMGLLPAKSITTGPGATYLNARGEMRIDLLTVAGRGDSVYRHEPLNVNLEPLKFMEFSLEKTTQTVAISGENALVVNIPSPVRYALHKLVVMAERQEKFRTKIAKDAGQVASIVSYALERSSHALKEAASDLMSRGKGWRSRVTIGTEHLARYHPTIAKQLSAVLKPQSPKATRASDVRAGEPQGNDDAGGRPRG